MKFLKFFLCSLICGLFQLTASVDSSFPENSTITQYLPLSSSAFFEVNGVSKHTESALTLVEVLLKSKSEKANIRAAIIIAINNGLVEKLTPDTVSNIEKIDKEVKLDSKMQEMLEKSVSVIFSFKPKDGSTDTFIELINGIIFNNKDKNKTFEALNNYLNIYESIVYDVCLNMQNSKFDAKFILNMQNSASKYVLQFILQSDVKPVNQQIDFVKKYFQYLSEQVQEEQSIKAAEILDVYQPDTVALYFNTDFGQDGYAKTDNLAIKTPSKLIQALGENSLRAQIIKAINNIIYAQESKFSDSIRNGLSKGKGKKKTQSQAFIVQVEEEVAENALLDSILNTDTLNISFLVEMLSGTTKDTLMPQVWNANKALSGLERIIYIICKELSLAVDFGDIIKKYLDENAQVIMGPIIEKFGSGDDLVEEESKVGPFGKLFDFYIEHCSDKLDSLKSDATQIAALEEQEVKEAKLAAELVATEEAKKQQEALAAEQAKIEAEKEQEAEEAKLAAAELVAKEEVKAKPTPKPRVDAFINCSTTLAVLQ